MRRIFLALTGLMAMALTAHAALVDPTVITRVLVNGSLLDTNGGSGTDATVVGTTVATDTAPNCAPGTFAFVTFTPASYLQLGANVAAQLTSTANYSFGFYSYKYTRAINTFVVTMVDSGGANIGIDCGIGDATTDNVLFGNLSNAYLNSTGLQICRYVGINVGAGMVSIYVGDSGATPTLRSFTAFNGSLTFTALAKVQIGTWAQASTSYLGAMEDFVFTNVSTTAWPYATPAAPTATFTNTPSNTPTATFTGTPSNTPTPTFTITKTSTVTPTWTNSPPFTRTNTGTMTRTVTATPSKTASVTRTVTPTRTNTQCPLRFGVPNCPGGVNTKTISPTRTPYTPSPTPTPENTLPALTRTVSPTRTVTVPSTATPTPNYTPSVTPTPSCNRDWFWNLFYPCPTTVPTLVP